MYEWIKSNVRGRFSLRVQAKNRFQQKYWNAPSRGGSFDQGPVSEVCCSDYMNRCCQRVAAAERAPLTVCSSRREVLWPDLRGYPSSPPRRPI